MTVENGNKNILFLSICFLECFYGNNSLQNFNCVNFCVIAHELGLAGAGEIIEEQEKFSLSVEMSSV